MSGVRPWPLLLALGASGFLAGCETPAKPQAATGVRYYANDLAGQAQRCVVPANVPIAAAGAEASMEVLNDGGWCGLTVAQSGSRPFDAGLLAARPTSGRVRVQTVGDKTRVDYIPDRGFSGTDAFSVRLLPGGATLRVAVAVAPGPASVIPAAAATPAPAATPARPAARPAVRPRRP